MDSEAPLKNRVRELRARLGLRQVDLAEAVGITRQTVIAIEKNRLNPSIAIALKMARVLREPVDYVFYLEAGVLGSIGERPEARSAAPENVPQTAGHAFSREEEAVRQAAAMIEEFASKPAPIRPEQTAPQHGGEQRESVEMPAFASLPEAEAEPGPAEDPPSEEDDEEKPGGAIWDFT